MMRLTTRRPTLNVQALGVAGLAVVAAVWIAHLLHQPRHVFIRDGAPVLIAPLVLWLFLSERYEVTVGFVLLYLGLADGVIKLGSGSNLATLGRDIVLYSIVAGAVVRLILRRGLVHLPPLGALVVLWIALCVVQVVNPNNVSTAHAVAALRQDLEFVPLFFLGYHVLRTERRLTGLLLLLTVVGAANGLVDVIQSRLSIAQLAAWGPGYHALEYGSSVSGARVFYTAGGGTFARPPGLGGSDGFGGFVCLMALPAVIALLNRRPSGARFGWLVVAGVLVVVGIVTSQTRLDVVGAIIAVVVYLGLTLSSRRGLLALLITVVVGLVGYFTIGSFTSSHANRYATLAPSQTVTTIITGRENVAGLVRDYAVKYPLGAGLGAVGPATGNSVGGNALARKLNGESEFTFLIVEVGVPGLLLMAWLTIANLRNGIGLRDVSDPELQRSLMAITAICAAIAAAWLYTAVSSNSPPSPFFWASLGALAYWSEQMRAGRIPRRRRRLAEALHAR